MRVCGRLLAAILAGPLASLGFVDVARDPADAGMVLAFRVRPAAAYLGERTAAAAELEPAVPLDVRDDLSVRVRAGIAPVGDLGAHAMVGRAGELIDCSPAGLRYRLSARRLQALFDAGTDAAALRQFLVERAAQPVPPAVLRTLDEWTATYGAVRLYDEVTVIELADDTLLPELMATTSLRSHVLHVFSPRAIAVEPAAVDSLVAELTRLGHAPQVVDAR